jgi:perosamine synthetase
MIAVQDQNVAKRLSRLRAHGLGLWDFARHNAAEVVVERYPEPGLNCRMTDMQGAIGLCQLDALDENLVRRRVLADRYSSVIGDMEHLEPRYDPPDRVGTWQSYCIRVLARRRHRTRAASAKVRRRVAPSRVQLSTTR